MTTGEDPTPGAPAQAQSALASGSAEDFQRIERAFRDGGAQAALDALCQALERNQKYPQLFEALLMQSRAALGLPLVPLGPATDLPEEVLKPHEDAIAAACRRVGWLYLKEGEVVAAWPYFRALGETAPVAAAIGRIEPGLKRKDLEEVIDIAIHQGVNPPRGLQILLAHSGICSAITAMERSPPASSGIQEECARVLVRELHRELVASVRADVARREPPPPPGGLLDLIAGRPWLFADGGYHVDPSHLNAVVRLSGGLTGGPELGLALEMAGYGRRLATTYQYKSEPPFEDFYADQEVFLRGRARASSDDDARAAHHFREKARAARARGDDRYPLGAVLEVLIRLGRPAEALDLSLELDGAGTLAGSPGLAELCQRAGQFGRLAEVSRRRDDLLGFAAGLVGEASLRSGGRTPNVDGRTPKTGS